MEELKIVVKVNAMGDACVIPVVSAGCGLAWKTQPELENFFRQSLTEEKFHFMHLPHLQKYRLPSHVVVYSHTGGSLSLSGSCGGAIYRAVPSRSTASIGFVGAFYDNAA